MKQVKGKGKGTAKKSAKKLVKKAVKKSAKKSAAKSSPKTKKPVNMARVRENINNLVGASAKDIAVEVIRVAKTGQLASAKYLFEAVGLYPATEGTAATPIEHSLAHTLLTRMGLPLDPVICDEDPVPAVLPSDVKSTSAENPMAGAAEDAEDGEEQEHGEEPGPESAQSEEWMATPRREGGEDTVE
jgi:hypothetical protein